MSFDQLEHYLAGIDALRRSIHGMSREALRARPVHGTWSTLEVLCHLADSEAVFADRMKRILAEERPLLPFADPALFAPALAYRERDADVEVGVIDLTRRQMGTILRHAPSGAMQRVGIHSQSGPCTLEDVLLKAVTHLAHHLRFIDEKRRALGLAGET